MLKRQAKRLALGTAFVYPLQWLRDLTFGGYANGDTASPAYSSGAAYVKTNRVRFNNRIYECIVAPPGIGYPPTNTAYWIQIQADWRGVNERVAYNGQKLILEYILNRWFNTTFNQPSTGMNSTYYITLLTTNDDTFFIGATSVDTGEIAASRLFQSDFIAASYAYQPYDFQVNYPVSDTADQITQMKSLISQYKLPGTNPVYVSY